MTDADDRLKALFAMDEPPARDPAFVAGVTEAIMRRRFLADVALLIGATVAGGATLWALWPALEPAVVAISQGIAPVAGALALAAAAVLVLGGRPGAAFGLES